MILAKLLLLFSTFVIIFGFGPRKLYTLDLPTTITSVKVIGRQIFFVGPWYISVVDNVHWKFMKKSRMIPRVVNKDLADPRMIGGVPTGTFKGDRKPHYWVTTYGTNVTSGAIYIMQLTKDYSEWGDISVDAGWNYERVQWVDMNRDGLKDCLTARFRGGIGQMLWFQQPPGQQIWNQRIIHEGMADGNFVGVIYDRKSYIIIAGNQFNVLGLYWTMNPRNNWRYSRQIRFRVVDNYGKYYDVQYVDLNKDGRRDVLTTTVQISNSRGHVLGYEIPYDIQNANWKRRVLSAGFNGDYAPGKATAYWPNKWKRKTDRPSIFLSGAGEEKLFILSPKPKTTGWGYIKTSLQAGFGMIGIPYVVDLNKDSYPEMFVPQGNQVHVFSYDYSSSAKEPPRTANNQRRPSSRKPQFPYRNAFFRPTKRPPTPAIPRDALPVANGLNAGSRLPFYPGLSPSAPALLPPTGISRVGLSSARKPVASNSRLPTGKNIRPPQAYQPPKNVNQPPQNFPPPNYPSQQFVNRQPLPQSTLQTVSRSPNIPHMVYRNGEWIIMLGKAAAVNPALPISQLSPRSFDPSPTPFLELPVASTTKNISISTPATPRNLVMSVTSHNYTYQSEARDACGFDRKALCSLEQLSDAVDFGGEVPFFDWGWFDVPNRAAKLQKCSPGEVKIEGYVCYNGFVEHLPVRQQTQLPGLCCSVVKWATMTKKKYSRVFQAEAECKNMSRHLCSLDEMMRVWNESSFKGHGWGWFRSQKQMLRMAHHCDPQTILWPGYQCFQNKLEVTEIRSEAQEKGFCCPSSCAETHLSLVVFIFSVLFALFFSS